MTQPPRREVRVARFGLVASDLARLEDFYCGAFGFERAHPPGPDPALAAALGLADKRLRTVWLRLGAQLVEFSAVDPPGAAYPPRATAHDPWFQHLAIVVANMDVAYERLSGYGIRSISRGGPQRLPPSSGSVTAFKFRDPDGHPLELLAFPEDGAGKWHGTQAAHRALGIDHTAIVVADTGRSVAFYERLGLQVRHRSLNRGIEQERLDAVPHVEVVVTALHAGATADPGIELLEYRSATDQASPESFAPQDLAATRVTLEVDDLERLVDVVDNAHILHFDGGGLALLGDPDGHLILCSAAPKR